MSIVSTEPKTIRVSMGGLKFAEPPDVLETLLGSCVGIAIWDERSGCGGLAHALLPEAQGKAAPPGKFVDTAVLEAKCPARGNSCMKVAYVNPSREGRILLSSPPS